MTKSHNSKTLVKVESLLTDEQREKLRQDRVYQVVWLEDNKGNFKGCFPLDAKVDKNLRVIQIDGNFKHTKVVSGG